MTMMIILREEMVRQEAARSDALLYSDDCIKIIFQYLRGERGGEVAVVITDL